MNRRRNARFATATAAAAVAAALTASSIGAASAAVTTTDSRSAAGAELSPSAVADLLTPESRAEAHRALELSSIPAPLQLQLAKRIDRLPSSAFKHSDAGHGSGSEHLIHALERVIDPEGYECAPTQAEEFAATLIPADISDGAGLALALFDLFGGTSVQDYEALIYATERPNRYGADDEYRKPLVRTLKDLKKFWDIRSEDIVLGSIDSDLWDAIDADDEAGEAATKRAATALAVADGASPTDTEAVADAMGTIRLLNALLDTPGLEFVDEGRTPLFTLNAYAFTGEGDPEIQADPVLSTVSDRIIFGEGLFEFLEFAGIEAYGPQSVMAHEFGHHIQFERDVVFDATDPADQPEATRRTELMADSLAGYYLAHKRGMTLNKHRIVEVPETFGQVGDCGFDDDGHHGTPNQRRAAATWGIEQAASAHKKGHVLPSATVIDRFEDALPGLVAPDAR